MRMRSRTVHPEFFKNADLYEAEVACGLPLRVAYEGLWGIADREGRFEWKPKILKLDILPFDALDFEEVLNALADTGFIVRYEVEDKVYGWVRTLLKWQSIHPREAQSKIPAPPALPGITGKSTKVPGITGKGAAIPGASTSTSASASTSALRSIPPNGAKPRGGWQATWSQIYGGHVGVMGPGRIAKRCAVVVAKRGLSRATEEWDVYCRQRRHYRFGKFDPEHNDLKATTPEDFAQTEQQWFELTEPIVHAPA